MEDFRKLLWLLAKYYGAEVLKILHDADREHVLAKLEEARVNAAGVKGERAAEEREREEKPAEREQERE